MSETSQSSSSTQAPAPKLPQNPVLLWFAHFANALERRDVDAATAMFGEECYWRDMLAFTWNVRTSEGRPAIRDMLQAQLDHVAPRGWRIDGAPFENEEGWHEGWLGFETAAGSVKAHVRVVDGKAWTLFTMLGQLRDHPPAIGHNRPRGQIHGPQRGRKPVPVKAQAERDAIGREVDPYVVIIGGGQGGMSLGARLKQLSVPYVILEANAKAGDSWRNRYPSLCLHDPVWYDHMPFIQFPPDWPVFTPRDQVADWLEMYARVMGLNYWTSSRVVGGCLRRRASPMGYRSEPL